MDNILSTNITLCGNLDGTVKLCECIENEEKPCYKIKCIYGCDDYIKDDIGDNFGCVIHTENGAIASTDLYFCETIIGTID